MTAVSRALPVLPSAKVDIEPGKPPAVRCGCEAPASRMDAQTLLRMEQVALAGVELQRVGMSR